VVDLALLDLPVEAAPAAVPAQDAAEPADGLPPPVTGGPRPRLGRGAVVALRGPGGAPLLGSSLLTEPASTRPLVLPGRLLAARDAVGGQGPLAAEAAGGASSSSSATDRSRARAVRRTSVLAGLSVAFALTLGLTLPDVTDPVCRDDDAPRSWLRRLKPRRRDREPAA
jgi:hypothetical protein